MIMHLPDAESKIKLLIPTVYMTGCLSQSEFFFLFVFFTPLILLTCNFEMNFARPLLSPY